jgi:hypothetical protein
MMMITHNRKPAMVHPITVKIGESLGQAFFCSGNKVVVEGSELVIGKLVDKSIDDFVDGFGWKCNIEAADDARLVRGTDDTSMILTVVGDGEDSLDIDMSTVVVLVVATVVRIE